TLCRCGTSNCGLRDPAIARASPAAGLAELRMAGYPASADHLAQHSDDAWPEAMPLIVPQASSVWRVCRIASVKARRAGLSGENEAPWTGIDGSRGACLGSTS